jgi:hypothetical protein
VGSVGVLYPTVAIEIAIGIEIGIELPTGFQWTLLEAEDRFR